MIEILKVVVWPLATLLFLIVFLLIFRKPISGLIDKMTLRYKKGDAELEVMADKEPPPAQLVKTEMLLLASTDSTESTTLLSPALKTPDELVIDMMDAILDANDFEQGEKLLEQLKEKEKDPIKKLKDEGIYYYCRYKRGDVSALAKMQDLAKMPDVTAVVHLWIGMCYESSGIFDRAAENYRKAAKAYREQSERASAVVATARATYKAGDHEAAYTCISRELSNAREGEARALLYEGLADLYELNGDIAMRALALESVVAYRPNDVALRFQTGFAYYRQKNHELLGLVHYKTLLEFKPDHAYALNNIGVAYSELGMPIRAIHYYRKAIEQGITLASANVAYAFMGAGFDKEATEVLDAAKQATSPHANVGSAIAALANNKEQEEEAEKKALDKGHEQQRFTTSFAEAYFCYQEVLPSFAGVWRSFDGKEMTVVQNGREIEGLWKDGTKNRRIIGQAHYRGALVTLQNESYSFVSKKMEFATDEEGKVYLSLDGKQLVIFTLGKYKHIALILSRVE